MTYLAVLFWLLLQAPGPAAPGIYCQNGANWLPLKPAPIAEMKPKGMGMFIDTAGYTGLSTNIVCSGSKAALRIDTPRPVFFVRDAGSAEDALIVRLAQDKDTRTIRTSTVNVSIKNKAGFKKGDIRKVSVTQYPDHSFSFVPKNDLKPGEYLIVFGGAKASFDFGIDKK